MKNIETSISYMFVGTVNISLIALEKYVRGTSQDGKKKRRTNMISASDTKFDWVHHVDTDEYLDRLKSILSKHVPGFFSVEFLNKVIEYEQRRESMVRPAHRSTQRLLVLAWITKVGAYPTRFMFVAKDDPVTPPQTNDLVTKTHFLVKEFLYEDSGQFVFITPTGTKGHFIPGKSPNEEIGEIYLANFYTVLDMVVNAQKLGLGRALIKYLDSGIVPEREKNIYLNKLRGNHKALDMIILNYK